MRPITTHDNGEPMDDWRPECRCRVCHVCLPAMSIPANIILGSE